MQHVNVVSTYDPTEAMRATWLQAYGAKTGRITVKTYPIGARTIKPTKPLSPIIKRVNPYPSSLLDQGGTNGRMMTGGVRQVAFGGLSLTARLDTGTGSVYGALFGGPDWDAMSTADLKKRKRFDRWSEQEAIGEQHGVIELRRGEQGKFRTLSRSGEANTYPRNHYVSPNRERSTYLEPLNLGVKVVETERDLIWSSRRKRFEYIEPIM